MEEYDPVTGRFIPTETEFYNDSYNAPFGEDDYDCSKISSRVIDFLASFFSFLFFLLCIVIAIPFLFVAKGIEFIDILFHGND